MEEGNVGTVEEGGGETAQEKGKLGTGFTRQQWILFVFFGLINLISAMTISIQAPFYPAEAEKKGATASEYGMVFGIFEFIVFLTAPIFGQFMNKIGIKTVFSFCLVLNAVAVICFGFLDQIEDHTSFIALSFLCRILEALGLAGNVTALFVVVACEFTSVATTFASLETFIGVGFITGPTVGGVLFAAGGFPLPFFFVGAALLVVGLCSILVLPKIDKATGADGEEQQGYGILTILKIPSVFLAAFSIVSTAMSLGFITATLEPHIRRFDLTPLQTGLVFIVNGGVYAVFAPLFGYICDKIKRPEYITVIGNLLICVAFFLIGPASFIPLETTLWVTIVGLLIQGLGFGCCFVSTFICGLRYSMEYGLPDNVATYGVVSGMWQSMISLGAWIGPSAGGALYDAVGFREGSWLIIATCFIAGLSIVIHAWIRATSEAAAGDGSEFQPLLQKAQGSREASRKTSSSTTPPPLPPSTSYGTT